MGTISIIGLGNFACRIIDELYALDNTEIFIADRDRQKIEQYRDKVKDSGILDVINMDVLKKILPEDTTHAIVDMGHDNVEPAILVTHYLHDMGIENIIVKSQGDANAEILKLVGATQVILPDLDAAQRVTQMLTSSSLFDFLQVSSLFLMAEVTVKPEDTGKTLLSCEFRKKYRLNVIAYRPSEGTELCLVRSPDFALIVGQHLLVAGTESDIKEYIGTNAESNGAAAKAKKYKIKVLDKLFRRG